MWVNQNANQAKKKKKVFFFFFLWKALMKKYVSSKSL